MRYEDWLQAAVTSPLLAQVLKDWHEDREALEALVDRQRAKLEAIAKLLEH